MIPQIIMIVLMVIGITKHSIKHGEEETDTYNGWHKLIAAAILSIILYFGGFWDVILQIK